MHGQSEGSEQKPSLDSRPLSIVTGTAGQEREKGMKWKKWVQWNYTLFQHHYFTLWEKKLSALSNDFCFYGHRFGWKF